MTAIPTAGIFTNALTTNAQAKQAQDDMLAVLRELLGGQAESELTIATGAVTPTRAVHSIDTEGDAAADDLSNMLTTNHPDGRILVIHSVDPARVVTVKHNAGGAGAIALHGSADFVLDSPKKWLFLKRTGTDWEELSRSFGDDAAAARAFLGLATAALTDANNVFSKGQRGSIKTLTDGATITPNMNDANDYKVTLGGNRTLANPTNLTAGQKGLIFVVQDGTGGRTLSYGTYWKFEGGTAPTLSTAAGAIDVLAYSVLSSTQILGRLAANFS